MIMKSMLLSPQLQVKRLENRLQVAHTTTKTLANIWRFSFYTLQNICAESNGGYVNISQGESNVCAN